MEIRGTISDGNRVRILHSITLDGCFYYCKADMLEGFYDAITIKIFKGYKAGLRVVDSMQFLGRVRALDEHRIEVLPLRAITYIKG